MKEIVENILREEEQAKKRLETARLEAERNILQAQKEAQGIPEAVTRQTRELTRQKKDELEKEYLCEKVRALAGAKEEAASLREKREQGNLETARKIFFQIINIPD